MSNNNNLHKAKKAKNDEFYTQLDTVEAEMKAYVDYNPDVFRGKTILCPCDDPDWSNFAKHFIDRRHEYGYKKLICTCYNKNGRGKKLVLENGVGNITALNGDGDFRSDEVSALLGDVDYIITNPPFSLFREFFAWIMKNEKKFSIIGNTNAITYKEVFPYIKENKIWIGSSRASHAIVFDTPDGEKKFICAMWFTNIPYDFSAYIKPLDLHTKAYWEERGVKYPKYDNYDAIEVSKTIHIPSDYEGVMGVPITWLEKYCPDQFEIIKFRKGDDDKDLSVNGECPYFRVLIKNKPDQFEIVGCTLRWSDCKTKVYTEEEYKNYNDLNGASVIMENGTPKKLFCRILIQHKNSEEEK